MKNRLANWYKIYKIHLLIWVLYIAYESVFIGFVIGVFGNPITYVSHYLVFIFFFYLHSDLTLPFLFKNKRGAFWLIPSVLLLEITFYILMQFGDSYLLFITGIIQEKLIFNLDLITRNIYRATFLMGFSTGYYFLKTYILERKRAAELEKQRLNAIINAQKMEQELTNAKNAFLKAQINPHFLFNTLDFVYHNVNEHSAVAGEAILRLSEMMRFAMESDNMSDKIKLIDEIIQVENLIHLYQIRKNHEIQIELSYTHKVMELTIIPLIILTLVENIFKHGNLSNDESPAIIAIDVENDSLCIYTNNLVNSTKNKIGSNSGLLNIEKRLQYAYGDEIIFTYKTTTDQHFLVKIEIPVKLLN